VMKLACRDALDERLLLLRVGELEIGPEVSGSRECLRFRFVLRRVRGTLPGFVAPNSERAAVRRPRSAFRSEKALAYIPLALAELRGAEGDVHAVRIVEEDVVVSVGVTVSGGPALASTRGGSFHRVSLQDPVTNVNNVDVLLHDDIAGKRAIIDPIPQSSLDRRGIPPRGPVEVS